MISKHVIKTGSKKEKRLFMIISSVVIIFSFLLVAPMNHKTSDSELVTINPYVPKPNVTTVSVNVPVANVTTDSSYLPKPITVDVPVVNAPSTTGH